MFIKLGAKNLQIPPKILEQVASSLEHIERHNPDWHLFKPQHYHYRLLFVCKEWGRIAERKLYASVSIDNMETSASSVKKKIFEAFYTTIKDTPRLASFVRELRMAVYFQSREQSFWYAEVLRLCSNVEHVTIMDNYSGLHK